MAILHVDDHEAIRDVVRRALGAFGYVVVSADGVQAATAALAAHDDITGALLDGRLRDGSGLDLYRWIIAHHPRLAGRVAFLTGSSQADAYSSLLDTGCPVLKKPFELADIRRLAAEWEGTAHPVRGDSAGESPSASAGDRSPRQDESTSPNEKR